MPEPKHNKGKSKQDYQTPKPFLTAVRGFLGIEDFDCDLFADTHNHVCPMYYTREDDAFTHLWQHAGGWNWANPEFRDASRVVCKAYEDKENVNAQTCILLPAGVSTNWFAAHVHQKALVVLVRPRLTFVGCADPYPKDLMLLLYSPTEKPGFDCWRWDE